MCSLYYITIIIVIAVQNACLTMCLAHGWPILYARMCFKYVQYVAYILQKTSQLKLTNNFRSTSYSTSDLCCTLLCVE